MNWVSERWLGGMLTNFSTIRKSVKRLQNIDKMESDGTFEKITKKERLFISREKDKLRKVLDGVESLNRIPGAMFIIDIKKESIALKEAIRLNIPVFAIVDTNCDPDNVDYIIPANDDAVRAVELITKVMADAVLEGLHKAKEIKAEELAEKEKAKKQKEEENEEKKETKPRIRKVKLDSKDSRKSTRKFPAAKEGITEKHAEVKTADTSDAEKDENAKSDIETKVEESDNSAADMKEQTDQPETDKK